MVDRRVIEVTAKNLNDLGQMLLIAGALLAK